MQIVIPMSGFGERFRKAGYKIPKPLIEVEGKPIIHHVIDMFPGEEKFIFICNEDHLNDNSYNMRDTILDYCPKGKIFSIEPHKLGPVHAVMQASTIIDDNESVIVNYCDFTCYWDWNNFKRFAKENNYKGIIPAYKGFHPHSLGTTNYAYIKNESDHVIDIQEKQPFTKNRMDEFASSGTYYFQSGALLKESLNYTLEENLQTGNEYYVSLAYKYLLKNNDLVSVYPLQHFMQWGTPEDVNEYNSWSSIFKKITKTSSPNIMNSYNVIPMAGLGKRFSDEGYALPKPLINVSGKPMVEQAVNHLPETSNNIFVIRSDMDNTGFIKKLKDSYKNCKIVEIPNVTDGQACTAQIGIKHLKDSCGPIIFAACDNGAIYDSNALNKILKTDYDLIVWGARGYINATRNPTSYGWLECTDDINIKYASVKKPLSNPDTDPVIMGTFIFKDVYTCNKVINSLIKRDGRVNNEFYLDSCINDAIKMNLSVKLFEVDHYLCWGTPNDLKTFEYWQSCFSKWDSHPYKLDEDKMIPIKNLENLRNKYNEFIV